MGRINIWVKRAFICVCVLIGVSNLPVYWPYFIRVDEFGFFYRPLYDRVDKFSYITSIPIAALVVVMRAVGCPSNERCCLH